MGTKGAQLGRGGTAQVYEWAPGQVLKLFTPQFAYSADAEYERTRAVQSAGVRCPAVIERVTVEDREGIVFERIDGPTLLETARDADALAGQLADLHAEIHAHEARGLPTVGEILDRAAARLDPADLARSRAALARAPEGRSVCHALFHPGHVLMSARGPVTIDWPDAFAGHPALDVARTYVFLEFLWAQGEPDEAALARRERFRETYLERYLAATPVTRAEVERCLPLPALALLRALPGHPRRARLEALAASAG